MEILIAIWVISGLVTYAIVIINGDDEFEGFGFFLSLLIGPLIILSVRPIFIILNATSNDRKIYLFTNYLVYVAGGATDHCTIIYYHYGAL